MKQLIYLSASALAALSFAACSSDNDVTQDINPTYDGKSVKTQFAISIAPTSGTTRMTSDETQATGNFNGIKDITLIATGTDNGNNSIFKPIQLATIASLSQGDYGTGDVPAQTSNYKLYSNLEIPVGTSTFLFYGQSNYSEAKGSLKYYNSTVQDFANVKDAGQTSDINFKLDYVLANESEFNTRLTTLVGVLNGVLGAFSQGSQNATLTENNVTGQTIIENQMVTLRDDFKRFTTAGSGDAVLMTLQNLYNSIETSKTANDNDNGNKVAQQVLDKIAEYCTASGSTAGKRTLSWNSNEIDEATANYPTNLGLPTGTAQVYFDSSEGQKQFKRANGLGATPSLMPITVTTIAKPAALAYFVESGTRVKDTDILSTTKWPSVNTWEAYETSFWEEWDKSAVAANTRSIALEKNIQYAVARLQTTIKCASSTLKDNRSVHFTGEEDSDIPVNNGFLVTGILIGGQPDKVDYKFLDSEGYNSSIYDKWIVTNDEECAVTETNTCDNHTVKYEKNIVNSTLVLTNESNTTNGKTVNVAVEFKNNTGSDFYGFEGGRIANGQKFYMVAQLNLEATTGVTTPNGLTTVFKQDYVTNATLSIKNLRNAYLTIPDLRSSQLQLGLSVDLSWQTGVTFEVDFQ